MTALEQLPARIDDLTSQISHLRTEMRDEFSAVRSEMAALGTKLGTQMRVLYEDLVSRLTVIQEGRQPHPKPKPRKKRA